MTSFARAEEERIFLERCYRLYDRIERIKARVDNKTPKCMFGSYLGKQNEFRKRLTSAGSTATASSGTPPCDRREFTLPENATVEQKIEHFLIFANYKRIPSLPKKRFPYLRRTQKVEPSPPPPVDVMELHSTAFTSSYPRIVRFPMAESKLRKMPLFYQKASLSSEDPSVSGNMSGDSTSQADEETSKSHSSASSDSASTSGSTISGTASTSAKTATQESQSDSGSMSGSQRSHHSAKSASRSTVSTASTISTKSSHKALSVAQPSTVSTVSTISSKDNRPKLQDNSISTSSREKEPRPSTKLGDKPLVQKPNANDSTQQLREVVELREKLSEALDQADEVSNADTTHDVPPMESENGVFNEEFDAYVDFLNDVTDVVLGMGVFSPSAIEAAIDAALATNVYGDVDRERAQVLVGQLFS